MGKALGVSHISPTLLTVATQGIFPVDIPTLGVVPPSPEVQLTELRYVPARAVDELQDSAIQHWRSVVITGQPGVPQREGCAKKHQTASEQSEPSLDLH